MKFKLFKLLPLSALRLLDRELVKKSEDLASFIYPDSRKSVADALAASKPKTRESMIVVSSMIRHLRVSGR